MVASHRHMYQYMKVCRSLKPAEKSYSQFKNEKIEKNKKTAQVRLELTTFCVTAFNAIHYTTSSSYEFYGFNRM